MNVFVIVVGICWACSGREAAHQPLEPLEMNHDAVIGPFERALHIVRHHDVVTGGVLPSEDPQSTWVELAD